MKYIVYCTINNTNNYLYVGVHKTQDPNTFDYYLGNGVYANNADTYKHPKTKFQYAVKEFGIKAFRRHTIAIFDNADDAYFLEEMIVNKEFLSRPNVYNMVTGGVSRTLNNLCINVFSYDLSGNFINEYSSINTAAKQNKVHLRSIWRAIHDKVKCAGYYWTKTKFDKLDLTYYGNKETDRGVTIYQYDNKGQYECAYDSISIASKILNINPSNLSKSITLGIKCAGKYFSNTYAPEFHRAKSEKLKNTQVHQYRLDGTYVKSWKSALEAQTALSIKTDLHKAIKLGHVAGGFQWNYELLSNMPNIQPTSGRPRKVGQYNGNKLIKVYDTVSACKKENGSGVQHVLSGRDNTHKGLKYKYLE